MKRSKVAVIGSGISGLSAAWLLSQKHDVVVFESLDRIGGHANTVTVSTPEGPTNVDTGFIVYNPQNYPNFTALLAHLDVASVETEMSFAVSLGNGAYEYSGSGVDGFFGQRRNLLSWSHWLMLKDILRFFDTAAKTSEKLGHDVTLGDFLENEGYSRPFINRHILPMAAAIWSSKSSDMLDYPARSFISFFSNHGMLAVNNRPLWRTVLGGSRVYVEALLRDASFEVRQSTKVEAVIRSESNVEVIDSNGVSCSFDQVVIAAHADDALATLKSPTPTEIELLGNFAYQENRAVLHRDPIAMPRRKSVWASWNYLQETRDEDNALCVTYWMNRLQSLDRAEQMFVTLNPELNLNQDKIDGVFHYKHPVFSTQARQAQSRLWQLQGQNRTWFCGSYFGYGFHEDGMQSGLAVAEQLGGVRRPWQVPNESGRITLTI